jgi:hypothetical protein
MNEKIFNKILVNNCNLDVIINFILDKKIYKFENNYLDEFNLIDKKLNLNKNKFDNKYLELNLYKSLHKLEFYNKFYLFNILNKNLN